VWKYSQYFNLSLGEVNAASRPEVMLHSTFGDEDAANEEDDEEEEAATPPAGSSTKAHGGRRAGPASKKQPKKSTDSIEKQVKDEVKDMVSGTVNAAVGAVDSAATAAGLFTDAAPSINDAAKLAKSVSDPALIVDTFNGAGSSFNPSTKATASLATAREIAGLESNGVADLGWHDAGAKRLETNLDVQAAMSVAQGADVDILLTTHEQHYGWEALDVLLNVAASESPQSVLSLSFGGMEKVRALDEDGKVAQPTANPVAGGNASASAVMADLFGSKQREAKASYVRDSHSWDTYERMDTEIAKLGLRGVTVIAASGDNGPFSYGIPNPYLTWAMHDAPCAFGPSFPASMPHVTSVGGTTGGKDPFKPERAAAVELGSKISSGGGFSSIFPQPEWQKGAVGRYLEEYAYDLPPESFFNQSNRAYPDVALAAEDIAIIFASIGEEPKPSPNLNAQPAALGEGKTAVDSGGELGKTRVDSGGELGKTRVDSGGELAQVRHYLTESSGTSYSAPLFAGMIALINDQRLAQNKSTVGFINPVLYGLHRTAADVFRDVKEGSSKCPNPAMTGAMVGCCKHGFRTGKGWDPLTGLGSVDFSRLRDELLKLP
jgi:tripeptidyl-peptidase-1